VGLGAIDEVSITTATQENFRSKARSSDMRSWANQWHSVLWLFQRLTTRCSQADIISKWPARSRKAQGRNFLQCL